MVDLIAFAVARLWPERRPAALAGLGMLAEAASVPGARREITWCLSGWLDPCAAGRLEPGWQPGGLPRLAARKLSEAHRGLCRDAIALEARSYLGGCP